MDKENYVTLLDALNHSVYSVIVAVVSDGKLIDWAPAADYCTLKEARLDHGEWPESAEVSLLYGLDALRLYSAPEHTA